MKTDVRLFGISSGKEEVYEYIMENDWGMKVSVISYGAAVRSIVLPDGRDIVLGFDSIEDYEKHDKYMGAVVGRCANRISKGRFLLGGKIYNLAVNNGPNHLHGGLCGFDKKVWKGGFKDNSVEFTLFSPDMEEGYPGNLSIRVRYTLKEDGRLEIEYFALSDKDTVVNITNHTYFNLSGKGTIEDHLMKIYADSYTEIDENGCSNGRVSKVEGTPLDFRSEKEIGRDINSDFEQIRFASGYDHNYILKTKHSDELVEAAEASADGVYLEVLTTQPGVHFYSGNFLDGEVPGKGGKAYEKRSGFALETQDWPDAVNNRDFPSVVLKKGEEYRRKTVWKIRF